MPLFGKAMTGWRPPTCLQAAVKAGSDRFNGCLDSGEMTVRSESHYTTTIRTAITFQQEKGVESIEKSLNKSMAPNFIMVAGRASCRSFPCIFPTMFKYFLENNRNKDYHLLIFLVVGSFWTRLFGAMRFSKTSSPIFLS